jgi:hypothetical protein
MGSTFINIGERPSESGVKIRILALKDKKL